jgi:hypothetical protein
VGTGRHIKIRTSETFMRWLDAHWSLDPHLLQDAERCARLYSRSELIERMPARRAEQRKSTYLLLSVTRLTYSKSGNT